MNPFIQNPELGTTTRIVLEIRLVIRCNGIRGESWLQRDTKALPMEIKILYMLGGAVVKQRHSFVKTHQSVHLKVASRRDTRFQESGLLVSINPDK